jgi:acetyl-CoA carboxylase carboxyltransferase component
VYDVRDVIRAIADEGRLLEWSARWARNMVCAFGRLDGRAVGFVCNQPRHLGGVIDADAAQKAARFIRTCNAYGLALAVLVDTPGYMPGTAQERAGVIRHGAGLLRAFATATVPRVTLTLRQSYGGGHIVMNSRDLGADLTLAWSGGRMGVMGARQAIEVVGRRALASGADRGELERAYEIEQLDVTVAARGGWVDEVIDPQLSRDRISAALESLAR